jgi:hypothetical protein
MIGGSTLRRDPFEGTAAYRRRLRIRIEGFIALAIAVVACGVTAALWLQTIAPAVGRALAQ